MCSTVVRVSRYNGEMVDSIIGQRVGNFEVVQVIGRGKSCVVYLGRHPMLEREVAIKILSPHLALRERMRRRFLSEARTAARLAHPNIVAVLDCGELPDRTPYFVMERLRGRTLASALRGKEPMSAAEVMPLVEQLGGALDRAHQAGVVHRDLRPDNVFLLDGDTLRLKLLDFGIAKMMETDQGQELATTTGFLVHDPSYLAPEQAADDRRRIGPQTDLYAFGTLIYHLLAGHPPFVDDRGPGQVLAAQIYDEPPLLAHLRPDLPEAILSLVHRCLEKEPHLRPATAGEVIEAFGDALKLDLERADADLDRLLADLRAPGVAASDETTDEPPPPTKEAEADAPSETHPSCLPIPPDKNSGATVSGPAAGPASS